VVGFRAGGPASRGSRRVLLVATRSPIECDWLTEWSVGAGLELRLSSPESTFAEPALNWGVALQVVEHTPARVRSLRKQQATPTLLICDRDADLDCRRLEPRADLDWVRRPCSRHELLRRAERSLRHAPAAVMAPSVAAQALGFGPLLYDARLLEFRVDGIPFAFRRVEREIFVYLMRNSERFVSTAEIQGQVLHSHGSGGAVRNQIYQIRRKLRRLGMSDALVHDAGKGYRLRRRA
jgi:DNA-binding response OmpR family regulator